MEDSAPDVVDGYEKYNDIRGGQQNGNYQCDAIGNLVQDRAEDILKVEWNVYGKIRRIQKADVEISYRYDAGGNRIWKKVGDKETFYVRDASGNVMSIYTINGAGNELKQSEVHLYGSSRLGILNLDRSVEKPQVNRSGIVIFRRGNKFFELSNHLGNVLATVSDKKMAVSGDGSTVDYYEAEVVSAQDYYPFGMMMPGRKYVGEGYRYGFNGQEKMEEITGSGNHYTAVFWGYDARAARRWNTDPKATSFPWQSPYATFNNNPIWFVDTPGDSAFRFNSSGYFMGVVVDGKKEWSIQKVASEKQVKNKTITTFTIYKLNDPDKDVVDMKYLIGKYGSAVPLLNYKSKADIKDYMKQSEVSSPENQNSKWSYAYQQSKDGGKMDYWGYFLGPEMLGAGISGDDIGEDRGAFYIFEGTDGKAYNSMDAGNYLWGAGMETLGLGLPTAKRAAHGHHILLGRTRHRQGGLLDAPADQRAIQEGYYNSSRISAEEKKQN